MRKIRLGKTDLQLSRICLGTAAFGDTLEKTKAYALLDDFVAAGGNFIDTANVYCRWVPGLGNCAEQTLGGWLRARNAYDTVHIATKGGHYHMDTPAVSRVTKEQIALDIEDSLRTMGLHCISLYWLHRDNLALPIEEIVGFMEEFVRAGKIRHYAASNFTRARLFSAAAYAKRTGAQGFCAVSNQWSLAAVNKGKNLNQDPTMVLMDNDLYAWHTQTGTPAIPYTATGQGFYEKLYRACACAKNGELQAPLPENALPPALVDAYLNPRNLRVYEALCALHKETGASLHTLSLAALFGAPFSVFPVAAARTPAQLEGLIQADSTALSRNLLAEFHVE